MHAHGTAPYTGPDLARYRDAVADLLIEIAAHTGPADLVKAEKVLTERLAEPEFAAVLAASPEGRPAAACGCSVRSAITSPAPAIAQPIWWPISGFTCPP